jgi:hypothetical protein
MPMDMVPGGLVISMTEKKKEQTTLKSRCRESRLIFRSKWDTKLNTNNIFLIYANVRKMPAFYRSDRKKKN